MRVQPDARMHGFNVLTLTAGPSQVLRTAYGINNGRALLRDSEEVRKTPGPYN